MHQCGPFCSVCDDCGQCALKTYHWACPSQKQKPPGIDYDRDIKKPTELLFQLHKAYIEAGFTVDQAFELTKIAAEASLRRPSIFG